jgi:hypothetical protein
MSLMEITHLNQMPNTHTRPAFGQKGLHVDNASMIGSTMQRGCIYCVYALV